MTVQLDTETVSPSEAARMLGISVQHLGYLARRGQVQFVPSPLGRLYIRRDVERLAAEREGKSA